MPAPTLDTLDIHSTDLYLSRGYPWREWDLLRREAPVFWYQREGIAPFWAVTRHADVLTISKRSDVFVNSQRLRLQGVEDDARQLAWTRMRAEARGWDPDEVPGLIFMDDPRRRKVGLLAARRFTPAALRKLESHFDELSRKFADEFASELDRAADAGETCDFVRGFAQKLPLAAIGAMLVVLSRDWTRLSQLTDV